MKLLELASSLRATIGGLHKGLRKQMYSVSSYSLTEMETIGILMRESVLAPSQLAVLTRVRTQSMSQILKKLEEQGVVKRTASKEDLRKYLISITASGRKLVEKTIYDRDEWLKSAIEKNLSPKEAELLVKALPILNKLLDR